MEEGWCNDKINQELIHGPISLLTTQSINFQCVRNDTEPQFEFDSLTVPYLKENSEDQKKRNRAVESKQKQKPTVGFLCCP